MKHLKTQALRVLEIVFFTSLITICNAQEDYGISVDSRWSYGPSFTLEKAENIAVMADGAMLMIYNVSDTADPQWLSSTELIGAPKDMELKDDILFIALEKFGLYIYNISDPVNPVFIGLHQNNSFYPRILVDGDIGYFTYSSGIEVLDLSDKFHPEVLYTMDLEYYPRSVTKTEEYLFTATYDRLMIWDVSDPNHPTVASEITGFVYPEDIIVEGNHAFMALSDTLYVIDVSDPLLPVIIQRVGDKYAFNQLALSDGYLYSTGPSARIYVYEWKDNVLTYKSNDHFAGFYDELLIDDNTLYGANINKGLDILDVSDLNNISMVSQIENHSSTLDIVADGDNLYIGSSHKGLYIRENSSTGNFSFISNLSLGYVKSIKLVGDYAFLAKYYDDLGIVDVSDPTNPIEIGTLDIDESTWDLEVVGEKAYLAQGRAGMYIVDISDLNNPQVLGSIDTEGQVVNVEVKGDHVFAADFMEGMRIIDVSDPTNPYEVGAYNDDPSNNIYVGNVFDVEIDENIAYIPDHSYGFQIIDISDVTNPTKIHQEWSGGRPYDIELENNFMYLALSYGGLKIYDISDPTNPEEIAYQKTGGELEKITLHNGKIYGADTECGFLVLSPWATTSVDLTSEDSFEMKVFPNPADRRSMLEINVKYPTSADLSVVTIEGKIISKMKIPLLKEGKNLLQLSDVMHYTVNAGMYYLVMKAGNEIRSVPVIRGISY